MVSEKLRIDFVIVGAGIIGLTLAREIKLRFPKKQIVVLEQEPFLGEHSSGRNSGVLHAGIYYPHQSLKHLLCVEGNHLWTQLSQELSINMKKCGKFIFSTSREEEGELEELLSRAKLNGVPDIRYATQVELTEIQKNVFATQALASPFTGIIDASEALTKLTSWLEALGVHILFKTPLKDIERAGNIFEINMGEYVIEADYIFNCAGMGAVNLREKLGFFDIINVVVKGNYLYTNQNLGYPTLYYPIPPKDLKGLGVHSTIDINGRIKFGPNTEEVKSIDYTPSEKAITEMKGTVIKYFKGIDEDRLQWDYAGCRSKIAYSKNQHAIHTDFWIESPLPNYIECLGIESPGFTASPAIARFVADKIK